MSEAPIISWLNEFTRCIQTADYTAGRILFDARVHSFGTVSSRVSSLEDLVEHQWKHVWGATEGFCFDLATAQIEVSGELACIAATWTSQYRDQRLHDRKRSGRATIVLRLNQGEWRAIHTHFSFSPAQVV